MGAKGRERSRRKFMDEIRSLMKFAYYEELQGAARGRNLVATTRRKTYFIVYLNFNGLNVLV